MALSLDILRCICTVRPAVMFAVKLDLTEDATLKLRLDLLRERHARVGTILWPDCLGDVDDTLLTAYFDRFYLAPPASFDVALAPTVGRLVRVDKIDAAVHLALLRRSDRLFAEIMQVLPELSEFIPAREWDATVKRLLELAPTEVLKHREIVWNALWERRNIERLAAFLNSLFGTLKVYQHLNWDSLLSDLLFDAAWGGDVTEVSELIRLLRPPFWEALDLMVMFRFIPGLGSAIATVSDLRRMADVLAYQTDLEDLRVVLVCMDRADVAWDSSDLRDAMHPMHPEDDFDEFRQILAQEFPHRFGDL